MNILILGLIIFLGAHSISIFAYDWRNRMKNRLGELPWKALYSVVSLLGFVLIVYGYAAARTTPHVIYTPPTGLRHLSALLMLFAFPIFLATYFPGKIQRTLKHPMLVATKIWALAHLLVNGTLADILLFGSFLVWAVADRISLKRRQQSPMITAPASKFNDLIAIIGGLILYVVFVIWAHKFLFGIAPFAM